MKVLVVSGSFKDVFSPPEATNLIRDSFLRHGYDVSGVPFCDGGEYTYEVLKEILFDAEEIIVDDVIFPDGSRRPCHYLIDRDSAHIVSSEILRLLPEEDARKNLLILTDYGFGQLIGDALKRGIRTLKLYLGGTSTVCFGMGMIQAMGAKLYEDEGTLIPVPAVPANMKRLQRIEIDRSLFQDVRVTVIADGNACADEMKGITALKVGRAFQKDKEEIVRESEEVKERVTMVTGFGTTRDFSGAAGGLLYGIDLVFDGDYVLGGIYFTDLLNIREKIRDCDLVVTGEGRYDNTACGKAPASVAAIAKSLGKPAVLVCGQIDTDAIPEYSGGILRDLPEAKELGFHAVLTCQEYYDEHPPEGSYPEQIEQYRALTPVLLDQLIGEFRL